MHSTDFLRRMLLLMFVLLVSSVTGVRAAESNPNTDTKAPVAYEKIYDPGIKIVRQQLLKSLKEAQKSNDPQAAFFASQLAALDYANDEFTNALSYLETAYKAVKGQNSADNIIKAKAQKHMGDCQYNMEKYAQSAVHYESALSLIANEHNVEKLRTAILRELSDSYIRNSDDSKAIESLIGLVELQKIQADQSIGWSYLAFKDAYEHLGKKELADKYFKLAVEAFQYVLEADQPYAVSPTTQYSNDFWDAMGPQLDDAPARMWKPSEGKPKAVLLCIHGMGLHKGSFASFGESLAKKGLLVIAIDVRGFGAWSKLKHPKIDFSTCISDIQQVTNVLKALNPGSKIFLVGESMGGSIVLQSAMKCKAVDAVISSVPAADRYNGTQSKLKVVWALISRPGSPYDLGKELPDQISKDEKLAEEWRNDREARFKLGTDELMNFNDFMIRTKSIVGGVTKPVLVTQGYADPLVKPSSTAEMYDAIAAKDKVLIMFGHKEHLIFENNQFSPVLINALMVWIDAHCN